MKVPLPVEAWKRDSGPDGRRSRDLSTFSQDRGLDGKPKARQIQAFMRAIAIHVIKEFSGDLPHLWAIGGQKWRIGVGRPNSGGNVDSNQATATYQAPAGVPVVGRTRTARWVPWALFIVELVLTSIVIGILSVVLVVQLTLTPGAIFGEFGGILTWVISLGVDAAAEIIGAIVVFVLTGLIVGILGLPIRLIVPVRRAWLGNGEVTVAGVVIGGLLLVVAYALGSWGNIHQDHGAYAAFTPSPLPLLIGWFVLALSLSLLVWPARWLPRRARSWWTETQLTKRSRVRRVQDNLTRRPNV